MSRVLRVAVPPDVAAASPYSGRGRMWVRVLTELVERVRLVVREPGRRTWRRPDVWLADGERAVPEVEAPLVVHVGAPAHLDAERDATIARAVRGSAVCVTPSEWSRRALAEVHHVPGQRFVVAPNGADLQRFRPGVTGGAELVGTVTYVLYLGALHPRKNVDVVARALGHLRRSGLPHAFVVVASSGPDAGGDPPPPDAIVLHRVEDTPLARIVAGASALCLPSEWEGFGLPCLEAMACGVPVVAADRAALPELVGDAGLLVEPEAEALTAALGRVLTEPGLAAELGRRGRGRALAYPWSRTADGWLAALERAAER